MCEKQLTCTGANDAPREKKPAKSGVVRVDLKSQLEEILEQLNNLYTNLEETFRSLDFQEVNLVLIEAFRDAIDKRSPMEGADVPDTSDEESDGEFDSDESEDEELDDEQLAALEEKASKDRKAEADKIKKMVECMMKSGQF